MSTRQLSAPPPLPPFEVSVRSSEQAVRDALQQILDGLAPLMLDLEEKSTVELVLAEALNNIVEHAYPPSHAGGDIHIKCAQRYDGLHLAIRDEGAAMPDGKMPIGLAPRLDVSLSDLPEGGFGWFLIKDLAKDVDYRRQGRENRLKLRLAIAMQPRS